MTVAELRQKYLDFFKGKEHVIVPSASLLPENDPTTLFTGSGMQPMVPYLLGQTHPAGVRVADSQKCFRAVDMDEVGDNRHTTFFEMLGNWSFGDYFKKEQVAWMFEFLTGELRLDPRRIYVTVFRGNETLGLTRDEETVGLWQAEFVGKGIEAKVVDFAERDGMQGGRIFYYDAKKNWWSRSGGPENMPKGEPGGPDTEMFWDFGETLGLHEKSNWKERPCHVNCDCGRFVEIGNNVFMQYQKTADGFSPLPKQNVDFGGGLERMAMAVQDDPDIFHLDVFDAARVKVEHVAGRKYNADPVVDRSFRVILDHLRAATFLIADGASPSNKDQGYFTRRLVRRAVRFGHLLGMQSFTAEIAQTFITSYRDTYPALAQQQERIQKEIGDEEQKFQKTLMKGIREFEKLFVANGRISGEHAFMLYATYGFPLELTEELAQEKGQEVDRQKFAQEFTQHQELSRAGAIQKFKGGLADTSAMSVRYHTATHLLHRALKDVLGDHINQKGSNITPERLRFDFNFDRPMTSEEVSRVEVIVNEKMKADLPVHFEEMTVEEAKKRGAIGLFGERYGEKVKVYIMGNYSMEICGGPHVQHTGELGYSGRFRILKEESSSAGVRRIKAVLQ